MSDISLRDLPEIPYEKREFAPIEEGDYVLTISSFDARVARTSGKPYITICFTVAGPENKGRKIWKGFFPYNDNEICRNNFWAFIKAATGQNLKRNFDPKLDLPGMIGRNVMARVTIETDNKGKDRNNATYFGIATDTYANAEYAPADPTTTELPTF